MRPLVLFVLFCAESFAQLQITTTSVPAAAQYQPYQTMLMATGGTQPYTWSVVSSTGTSLPEGMSLNPSTGLVSAAQVNGQGGYAVTIQVTDSASPAHNVATATINFGVTSDPSYGGCQMFPPDSIYNQRIDLLPVDTNAAHQIPSVSLTKPIHPDFGHGFYPAPGGIPFMRVAANQPPTNVNLAGSGQIDGSGTYSWPFPAWPNAVVEGTSFGLDGNDHHILILESSVNNITGPQTGPCTLYETYQSTAVPSMFNAATNTWLLSAGVHYVLNSNEIAASAATLDDGAQDSPGIPMVPLLIRYSEVPLGVRHPLRITFPSPTNWFVWPATGCCAGSGPPQGLLYRLKASVNWQAVCPVAQNPQAATVLQALQQYGAYMSDHGSAAFIQGVPDIRWNDDDLACIKNFHASDLEVVDNSALEVSAISGQTKPYVAPATLTAATVGTTYHAALGEVGGNPASLRWSSSGTLPPGLLLNASTGSIDGTPTSSAGSPYSFNIMVTDTNSGLSSQSQAFSIAVTGGTPAISVTVTTTPANRLVTVDGTTYTAPQSFQWVPASSHSVSAPSPQGTGTRYVFAGWSDGGLQTHLVALTTSTTLTASFTTQYLLTTAVSPTGSGRIAANPSSGDGYYNSGAAVQLTASPAPGFAFTGFSGALGGTTNPQTVTLSGPLSVTAHFLAAPSAPVLDSPKNAATGVSRTPTLTWSVSAGAVSYDVYFGTTSSPGFVENTGGRSYDPGKLTAGKTYYWRIVAQNSAGSNSSAVWSFTTR